MRKNLSLIILTVISFLFISCGTKDDMNINDYEIYNSAKETSEILQEENDLEEYIQDEFSFNDNKINIKINESIELSYKSISQEEYDKWVIPMYEGLFAPDSKTYDLPDISNFDYPYVKGMDDLALEYKVNDTIKNAIFNGEFFDCPMLGISIGNYLDSEIELPDIIIHNDILSIPIVLDFNREKWPYSSKSVTIDLKTGERLFLEDIVKLNEELTYNIIYKKDFYIDPTGEVQYLFDYPNENSEEAAKDLLSRLRDYNIENQKPQNEFYYFTKDGIVLTYSIQSNSMEINIPLVNLKDYLKIDSWN